MVIIFVLALLFNANAQSYLLIEEQGCIKLVEYSPGNIKYGDIRGDNQIVLTRSDGFMFVGYNWDMDSLILFLEKDGIVVNKKLKITESLNIPYRNRIQEYNLERFWRDTGNNEISYQMDEYLIIKDMKKSRIKCYKKDSLLWSINNNIRSTGVGYTSASPAFSLKRKVLLFQHGFFFNERLIEIDLLTGKKKHLVSNAEGTYFAYSSNGKYVIYYNKKRQISIYNTGNGKKEVFREWKKAYWLYK